MSLESLFESLGNAVIMRELRIGEYVHHQGDYAETVSFVQSGQVVVEAYPTGSWEAHPIKFVGPGGLIGEEAIALADGLRSSTVRALCDVRLGVVYRDDLRRAVERSPAQSQFVIGLLVASLQASHNAVLAGVCGSATARVTRLLLHADDSLAGAPGSLMHLTQNDLARLAGLQRPTANRVLKELESSGCIELKRSRVRVLDRTTMEHQLEQTA